MTSRLILARHGNTFNPQDTPVWVGARSDLPLVEKGLAQAKMLADSLQSAHIMPDSLSAGSLQRTRQAAMIVAETLGIAADTIRIDPRLTEIDYGTWEGKSSAEIEALGDGDALEAWHKDSVFPVHARWQPSQEQIIANIAEILSEIQTGTSLIVTSNGILRFFARAAVNAALFPDRKVLTGHVCVMERDTKSLWNIVCWNQKPEILK